MKPFLLLAYNINNNTMATLETQYKNWIFDNPSSTFTIEEWKKDYFGKLFKNVKELIMKNKNYVIFHIEGGIGKNIMATAVAKAIKKKYPERELIIVTAWEDVWFNHTDVSRVYKFGALSYFYEDMVKDNDSIIMMHDPYHSTEHIYGREHLIKTWCELFGLEFNNEEPELFLTPREIDFVRNQILGNIQKPIFIIQPNGGMQDLPYSWSRDIPFGIAQDIVNHYAKDFHIFQIKRENQPLLNNANALTLPLRQLFTVLLFSNKRLFIDSFGQHAAAALGLPSTVTWIINKPNVFGYDMHENIVSDVKETFNTTKYSYLSPYNITGAVNEYPYDTRNILDINKILDALTIEKESFIKYDF